MTRNWWTEPLADEWLLGEETYSPEERATRRAEYYLRNYAQIVADAEAKACGTAMMGIGAPEAVLPGSWQGLVCVAADLDAALDALTEKQRTAVWACWVEGAEQEAVAEEEGVRQQSIHDRLSGARKNIGHYLARIPVKSEGQFGIPIRREHNMSTSVVAQWEKIRERYWAMEDARTIRLTGKPPRVGRDHEECELNAREQIRRCCP